MRLSDITTVGSQRRIVTIVPRCIDRQNTVTGPRDRKIGKQKNEQEKKKKNGSEMDLLGDTFLRKHEKKSN